MKVNAISECDRIRMFTTFCGRNTLINVKFNGRKLVGLTASALIAIASVNFTVPAMANGLAATETTLTFEDGDTLGADAVGANDEQDKVGAFEGAITTIEDVPVGGGTGKGLHLVKQAEPAGQPWAGATLMDSSTSNIRITAADLSAVTFDYYSPDSVNSPIMLKLENAQVNIEFVKTASPGWNSMSFDFSTQGSWSSSIEYTKITVFPNWNNPTVTNTGQTYVFDNFKVNTAGEPVVGPHADPVFLTFEDDDVLGAGAVGNNSNDDATGTFSGATTTIADVPAGGGDGKGLNIAKAGDPWSGVTVLDISTSEVKITAAGLSTITFDYYSPDSIDSPIVAKIEGEGGSNGIEFVKTASPGWNSMSFDFSTQGSWSASNVYTKLTLFPNWTDPTVSNTGQIYVVDNLGVNGGKADPSAKATVLTFESDDAIGTLVSGISTVEKPTGAFEGASVSIQAAPAGCDVGDSLHFVKEGAAWSGATLIDIASSNIFVAASGKSTITLDYYSPDSVMSPLMLKIEGAGGAGGIEFVQMAVPGWQTLSYDFSTKQGWNSNFEYTRLAIFPNFDPLNATSVTNSGQVYVIDNVSLNGGVVSGDCTQPEEPEVIAPTRTKAPTLSGTAKVGKTLTAKSGTFTGTDPVITYRWYVCAKAAKASASKPGSLKCKAISSVGTKKKMKVAKSHAGKFLRVSQKATNSAGSVTVYSATSKKIAK
jgi:hypothetical protein